MCLLREPSNNMQMCVYVVCVLVLQKNPFVGGVRTCCAHFQLQAGVVHMQIEEANSEAVRLEAEEEEEEEYVMLDLDEVFHGAPIPANYPFTLSGLDTLSPILTLGDGLELIGEYEETVGTVLVYSETEEEQVKPGEFPVPIDFNAVGKEDEPQKRVQGVCKLERKIKFRKMQTESK